MGPFFTACGAKTTLRGFDEHMAATTSSYRQIVKNSMNRSVQQDIREKMRSPAAAAAAPNNMVNPDGDYNRVCVAA